MAEDSTAKEMPKEMAKEIIKETAKGKVLVTGGAGFIGSHITDMLIDNEYNVVVVDNFATGSRENLNPSAIFYEADITDREKLNEVFEKEKPEFVVHTAAQINVRWSMERPQFDAKVNIIGVINLLECCKNHSIKKIIYSATGGACYGEPKYMPCDEKHPVNPICHYGASKYSAEHFFYVYSYLYGLDYVILRYSNVYGPRQDPRGEAGVISIFLDKLLKGEQPKIFGDGEQTRDFVYVGDVAMANLLALEKNPSSKIINIATEKRTSVNLIYNELKAILKSSISPVHTPPVPGEVRHISLAISLARAELGWKPSIEIKEGLKKTAEWFVGKANHGADKVE